MIYRRFTEKSAEEWRQIYKALQLLEFLIKHGSERVIDDARGHLPLLKMLRQFHFIDQNGKDQGINVRNRAKELAELLSDVERIRTERKKARATKNKYTGVEGGMSFGGGFSGSGGRYGGFGSESAGAGAAGYGGYSGGVYGDGGGFGGEPSNDFRETSSRSERFEEYDEFDEDDRPARQSKRPEQRVGVKKTTAAPPKAKEPEIDLLPFDDPEPATSSKAPAKSGPANGSSALDDLIGGSSSGAAANDDDEFDDFQSAAPSTSTSAAQPLSPPLTSTASSTAQFAAPQPLSAPQQANISQMVNNSSISPAPSASGTPGVNYSAFSAPAAQPPKPAGYQPSGPNYFGTVPAQQSQAPAQVSSGMSGMSGMTPSTPSTMAGLKPASSTAAKPAAAAGGDAFGALWGKASGGIQKKGANTSSPSVGQLAKEKSSAGIWGAPATGGSQPPPSGGSGSAMGDLLG
jgi:epsin